MIRTAVPPTVSEPSTMTTCFVPISAFTSATHWARRASRSPPGSAEWLPTDGHADGGQRVDPGGQPGVAVAVGHGRLTAARAVGTGGVGLPGFVHSRASRRDAHYDVLCVHFLILSG